MAQRPWDPGTGRGMLCRSDCGRGSPVSSEPPAAAAVVLPDPDNSPMSHAAGCCVGSGARTGPHCVPAAAQRSPAPTGFTGGDPSGMTTPPRARRCWRGQILSSPSSTNEDSLASAPSRAMLSTHLGKGSRAAPGASLHHSQGGKAPSTLAEPCSHRGLSRGKPAMRWERPPPCSPHQIRPLHPPSLGSPGTTTAPRGREHPGQPQRWPPARGSGDSQSCPAIISFPSSRLAGSGAAGSRAASWQSRPLAGTRLAGGSQPGARSGQRELTRFLPPQAAPRRWADKARPPQVPKRRPGHRPPGPGAGDGGSRETAGPHLCKGANTRVPTCLVPQELRPLLSLPFPFILCICTYMVKKKSSSSTRLHRGSVGTAQPDRPVTAATRHAGHQGSREGPGNPPTGDRPTLPSASPGGSSRCQGWPGWGHPRDPRAVWRVKRLGWIRPSEGWGASPRRRMGLEARGLRKVPKKTGELEPPTVLGAPSELQSQVLPRGKSPLH